MTVTENIQQLTIPQLSQALPPNYLTDELQRHLGKLPYAQENTFSNRLVEISSARLKDYKRLQEILSTLLETLVYNYQRDYRIQCIYLLDDQLREIMDMTDGIPFRLGMFRPDFIYDQNGQPRICEIGTRFPVNGWMLSYYLNQITQNYAEITSETNWEAIPELEDCIDEFIAQFNPQEPIFLVHEQEKGTEIFYLQNELAKRGVELISITPKDLQLTDQGLIAKGKNATQFILEMDREELKTFDSKVLKHMIQNCTCINDVRSLILIHDKNLLALLYNQEIMGSYINGEDYLFLKSFLIPSYTLSHSRNREILIDSNLNWVLKKTSGGRGIDMYIKDECSKETWKTLLEEHWREYMVQEYIPQTSFNLSDGRTEEKVNLVGLLLCFNRDFFGTGLFRASSEKIINVHEGKGLILPSVLTQ